MSQVTTPAQAGHSPSTTAKKTAIVNPTGLSIAAAIGHYATAEASIKPGTEPEPMFIPGKKTLTKTCIFTRLHIEIASNDRAFREEVKIRIDAALRKADLGLVHKVEPNTLLKKGRPKLEVTVAVNTDRIVEVFDVLNRLLQDSFFGRTRTRVGNTTVQGANGKDYTFAKIPMKPYVRSQGAESSVTENTNGSSNINAESTSS